MTIHPSSVLFHSKPSCIVFTELIQTGKRYVRQVTLIDRDWIEELPKETILQLRQVMKLLMTIRSFHVFLFVCYSIDDLDISGDCHGTASQLTDGQRSYYFVEPHRQSQYIHYENYFGYTIAATRIKVQ